MSGSKLSTRYQAGRTHALKSMLFRHGFPNDTRVLSSGVSQFNACEFSLAPWQEKYLERSLKHYIGLPPEEADREQLAHIIKEAFPPDAIRQIKRVLNRVEDAPVIIHHLPELKYTSGFANRLLGTEKKSKLANETYAYWIAEGLFELTGCEHKKSALFCREGTNDGYQPAYHIHRDINPVSALSVLHNPIHARTEFIDVKGALRDLSSRFKNEFMIEPLNSSKNGKKGEDSGTPISLAELERNLDQLRYNNKNIAHGIVPVLASKKDLTQDELLAMQVFHGVMRDHSISVDLQPGSMVIWDTVYHRAKEGRVHSHARGTSPFTRVAYFGGADEPSITY